MTLLSVLFAFILFLSVVIMLFFFLHGKTDQVSSNKRYNTLLKNFSGVGLIVSIIGLYFYPFF
ncbi:hypothetical protein AM500_19970 [Bacillus sp. FJAT-18017]|uniref:hypothetical protein n=1 Tax=Bacillus sp. FJAT-18017 TaxID=1705566 RepID=UPI0006B00ABD|nr:hypothetical protein [Bacillus sp. FJAT-18017]ALC91808.1 hypothetical protein AM500_19970 [Bacillus sp. FJAT-18017]